jgi:hypothetical protein
VAELTATNHSCDLRDFRPLKGQTRVVLEMGAFVLSRARVAVERAPNLEQHDPARERKIIAAQKRYPDVDHAK